MTIDGASEAEGRGGFLWRLDEDGILRGVEPSRQGEQIPIAERGASRGAGAGPAPDVEEDA